MCTVTRFGLAARRDRTDRASSDGQFLIPMARSSKRIRYSNTLVFQSATPPGSTSAHPEWVMAAVVSVSSSRGVIRNQDLDTASSSWTSRTQHANKREFHIFVPAYMMCAFGVPGNMIQGDAGFGRAEMPVVSGVANGMYVTKSEFPPLAFVVTESKLPPKI